MTETGLQVVFSELNDRFNDIVQPALIVFCFVLNHIYTEFLVDDRIIW